MKKILFILIAFLSVLFAVDTDTSSTTVSIRDMQIYNIVRDNDISGEGEMSTLKPFALIQPEDKWFSKDKWMHFTTAYFVSLQSNYTLNKMFYTPREEARNISLGLTLSLSLGKEFYDVFAKKSIFSWKDLCYDILGAGLGYYTSQLINK